MNRPLKGAVGRFLRGWLEWRVGADLEEGKVRGQSKTKKNLRRPSKSSKQQAVLGSEE